MNEAQPKEYTLSQGLVWLTTFVRRHFLAFVAVGVVCLVTGYGASFLMPVQYRAEATLLPPADRSPMSGMLAQLGAVSGMLGVGGGDGLDRLYPDIIESRRILNGVLETRYQDSSLLEILGGEEPAGPRRTQLALEKLQEAIRVRDNVRTGLIEVFFQGADPEFSAFALSALLAETDSYLQANMRSESTEQLELIERRLEEIKLSLAEAEEALRSFREKNSMANQSPALSLEQGRLMREVEINSETYIALMKQRELTRLQSSEESSVLRILDAPTEPLKPIWPPRVRLAGLAMILGLGLAFAVFLWKDRGMYGAQD